MLYLVTRQIMPSYDSGEVSYTSSHLPVLKHPISASQTLTDVRKNHLHTFRRNCDLFKLNMHHRKRSFQTLTSSVFGGKNFNIMINIFVNEAIIFFSFVNILGGGLKIYSHPQPRPSNFTIKWSRMQKKKIQCLHEVSSEL